MTSHPLMRLFVALPLPGPTRAALDKIIRDLKHASAAVRWVQPDNLHLTLRFLGDTEPLQVPELQQLIDRTTQKQSAVTLTLDRLGAFPNLRNPRVYWIGTADSDTTGHLSDLAQEIEFGVRDLGFQAEKKLFKPHLTLGRVKQPDNLDRLARTIATYRVPSIAVPLTRLVLFHSTLTPRGPVYKHLHESSFDVERFQ